MTTVDFKIYKYSDFISPAFEFTSGLTNKAGYAQIRDINGVLVKNFTVTIDGNYLTFELAKADVAGLTVGQTYYSDLKLKDTVTQKETIQFLIEILVFEARTQTP